MSALDANTTTITAALALAGLQIGLFAWLKSDIRALTDRLVTVEREVAFMRGQFFLAFPAVAHPKTTGGSEVE